VPDALLLWRDLHVRKGSRDGGKPKTKNVRIEVAVEGISGSDPPWLYGLEFDYANDQSLYCRPMRDGGSAERLPIPAPALTHRVVFLPPMSGLVAQEARLDPGAVDVRVGEGRTAEVLLSAKAHLGRVTLRSAIVPSRLCSLASTRPWARPT